MDSVIWKPVKGFEGFYEVSNNGIIRGVERTTTTRRVVKGKEQEFSWVVPSRIIKQGRRRDGYADVPLTKHGVSENYLVHRILAEAFLPNPDNLSDVNHIDGDKTNNSLNNLEWCTREYNNTHAVYHGLQSQCIKVKCVQTGQEFPSMAQAERKLGLPLGSVGTAIAKNRPLHGYTFVKI